MPPATTDGTVAITLRKPSERTWMLYELASRGIFNGTRAAASSMAGPFGHPALARQRQGKSVVSPCLPDSPLAPLNDVVDPAPNPLPPLRSAVHAPLRTSSGVLPPRSPHAAHPWGKYDSDPTLNPLQNLLTANRFEDFLRLAVQTRQNILLSGPTGSGKTTLTKALIREIPPHERLITIEDTRELDLTTHPNHVRLYYSKDGQGTAKVTPRQLLEATLRMKPDRVLLAELRSEEAFYYLRNINSGHPGSITSVHAASAELAFEQLVLLVKENESGRELARTDILQLLHRVIDVVVQFQVCGGRRSIGEIWHRGNHGWP
jgi:type IV secretory pathway ATPase VirB11/archaellum biosynthesis ATPase